MALERIRKEEATRNSGIKSKLNVGKDGWFPSQGYQCYCNKLRKLTQTCQRRFMVADIWFVVILLGPVCVVYKMEVGSNDEKEVRDGISLKNTFRRF